MEVLGSRSWATSSLGARQRPTVVFSSRYIYECASSQIHLITRCNRRLAIPYVANIRQHSEGWLSLVVAEGTYHQALERGLTQSDDVFQRRVERAQRRYLAAIKALAQMQKLGGRAGGTGQHRREA